MYVVQPQLRREAIRVFNVVSLVDGEQADYSTTLHTVEIPLWEGVHIEDQSTPCKKVQPGEVVLLMPKVSATVRNAIVQCEVHEDLYRYGKPTFKRLYRNGDSIELPVTWECHEPYTLSKLPFLYEAYIINQVIRGAR